MTDTPALDPALAIRQTLRTKPRVAHEYFFQMEDKSAPFHFEMIDLWHSSYPFVQTEAFRGGGKSTTAEKSITLMACEGQFFNGLVIGASEERAIERLQAIKHEIEFNERIHEIYGDLVGDKWGERKLVLRNGVCLQAKGRGQSLRGTKHLKHRPDIAFLDDVEQDEEFVPTEENCKKVTDWLFSVVIPGMHPRKRRVRVAGTPGSPFSLTMQLRKMAGWKTRRYPIKSVDPTTGRLRATWEARFPLDWVEAEEKRYDDALKSLIFQQEYMLEPVDSAQQIFLPEHLKVDTKILRTWQPVYVMYDPARTATVRSGKTTALTGKAVWSYFGAKIIIWEIGAYVWKPDDLIKDAFDTDDKYAPVYIGVEEDGLNEFIFQPLRSAMVTRGHSLPIRALKAPKGKIDFIKGLQPFAAANELIFACDMSPHIKNQFLNFPNGIIDAPNALAYALKMRPGQVVYPAFGMVNIMEGLEPSKRVPFYLALNASKMCTTGVLLQFDDQGCVKVMADWVTEDPPGAALRHIIQSANRETGGRIKLIAGPQHYEDHENVGLRAAATKIPVELSRGGLPFKGREELRSLLSRQPAGRLPLQVSTNATWTLRALNGGYARDYDKQGNLNEFAVDNQYKVLMEGLESLMALNQISQKYDDTEPRRAYARDGRPYNSALPQRTSHQPLKSS